MMDTPRCPSPDELERLLDEQLAPADLRRVSDHVAACVACQRALETLTADDGDSGLGPRPGGSADDSAPPHLAFLDRMKHAPPSTPQPRRAADADGPAVALAAPEEDEVLAILPVLEDYEILGVLGQGGEGVVYKARHRPLGRLVALKMMHDADRARPETILRFRQEAETLAKLRHPNIVQVYEVGSGGGRPFFAMEYVEGGTLSARLRGQPEPARPAAELVEALALAVHAAHQAGVVHRDLKPGNVLLVGRGVGYGVPKITDFGLAKRVQVDSSLTRTGMVLGTPAYMAPEQARAEGREVSPASDVYSLGSILYHLLTGRPPFVGARSMDVLLQLVHDEPVAPRRLFPHAPRDLENICLKCLQKEPRRRYASAAALADDLRSYLDGRSIQARPAPAWERTWKAARRRPVAATLLAACAAALALLVGGGAYYNVQLADAKQKSDENALAAGMARQKAGDEAHAARAAEKKAGEEADAARAAEKAARASAAEADRQRGLALEAYETLVFEVQDRLGFAAATRPMRQALLKTAADGLKKIAKGADETAPDRARAAAHMKMGRILFDISDDDGARGQFETCRDVATALVKANSHDAQARNLLCLAYSGLGNLAARAGRSGKATESFNGQMECAKAWLDAEPDDALARERLAESYNWLAGNEPSPLNPQAYEQYNNRLADLVDAWIKADPASAMARYYKAAARHRAGRILVAHGDPVGALACFLQSKVLLDDLIAEDPTRREFGQSTQSAAQALSAVYVTLGQPAKALPYATAEAAAYRETLASGKNDPENLDFQWACGDAYVTRAAVLMRLMQHEAAAKELTAAAEVFRAMGPKLTFGALMFKVRGRLAEVEEEIAFCQAVPIALNDPAWVLQQPAAPCQDLLIIRACLLTTQGSDEAEQAVELVESLRPADADECLSLAHFLGGDLAGLTLDKEPEAFTDADLAVRQRFIDCAVAALNRAADLGFKDATRIKSDDYMWVLHQDPGFRALLQRLERSQDE